MKKSDLIDALAGETGATKGHLAEVIDALGRIAARELKTNGEFAIHGVVAMKTQRREERNGRNPQTGENIRIGARNVVKATPANQLKQAV